MSFLYGFFILHILPFRNSPAFSLRFGEMYDIVKENGTKVRRTADGAEGFSGTIAAHPLPKDGKLLFRARREARQSFDWIFSIAPE